MKDKFSVSTEQWVTGFQLHINALNPLKDAAEQLERRYLYTRSGFDKGSPIHLKKIIEFNSSLRVNFGWSFESIHIYEQLINECLSATLPNYNIGIGNVVSDLTCSWLGFVPHNIFERVIYDDLSTCGLILFNNEIINFQQEIIQCILDHKIYRQHAILRDSRYRFDLFKQCRKYPQRLAEEYRNYIDSIQEVCGISGLPRDLVEEDIGVHFLSEPDLFYELLGFSILKGEVYE